MTSRRIDAEIDHLYRLAPDEFTAARNALAKQAGPDAAEVKKLTRPPLPAWAINQLFWRRRPLYDALVGASTELRQTHKAVLNGRQADLRAAGKVHETALDAALKGTLAIVDEQGQPATDATRQAILTTLRALPAGEPPGRLTRTLQPGGFEMLAGLSIAPGKGRTVSLKPEGAGVTAAPKTPAKGAKAPTTAETRADARARAQAAEAAARAARELQSAEHTARREEFEAARSAREAEKAIAQLEQAKEALANAQRDVKAAEAAAAAAGRARDAADRRAREAERALEAARKKVER
jgi:hypothetical protein